MIGSSSTTEHAESTERHGKCYELPTNIMLENKVGLIFGVANKRSIAWACASACAGEGAKQAFTYQGDRIKENVEDLATTLPDSLVVPCDVSDQAQVDATFEAVKERYGKL